MDGNHIIPVLEVTVFVEYVRAAEKNGSRYLADLLGPSSYSSIGLKIMPTPSPLCDQASIDIPSIRS